MGRTVYKWAEQAGQTVYKLAEQVISWLNGLYPGRMVEAVTTFVRVAAYQAPEGLSTSVDSRV